MNLNAVTNILLQDAVGRLAMIIPSSDAKSILCLYYADTCFRLFKIDPIRPQEVNPPTNYLNYIVLKRSGDIQPATDQEWHEAYAYVKEVSPKIFNNEAGTTFDFGVWRFHYSRSFLLDRIENQIDNTKAGFSD